MIKGEVWWAEMGPTAGHEQSGKRPVIVYRKVENLVVSVPLTSQMERLSIDYTMMIYPDKSNNLPRSSLSLAFQIKSLDISHFISKIGMLSVDDINGLDRTLKDMLALA
jgi:mRNA-degrading endonuclease toxin of MazEF toxin-antitoxin module